MVSHSNMQGKGSNEANFQAQQEKLMDTFNNPFTQMLEPSNYWSGGHKASATTFGLREGKMWKFYYQKWSLVPNENPRKFRTFGVEPIDW